MEFHKEDILTGYSGNNPNKVVVSVLDVGEPILALFDNGDKTRETNYYCRFLRWARRCHLQCSVAATATGTVTLDADADVRCCGVMLVRAVWDPCCCCTTGSIWTCQSELTALRPFLALKPQRCGVVCV
jgi:hypothetical protein